MVARKSSRSSVVSSVVPKGRAKKRAPAKKAARKRSAGVSSVAGPSASNERLNVRKISNGYLASRSVEGRYGYKETETFYAKKPKISLT